MMTIAKLFLIFFYISSFFLSFNISFNICNAEEELPLTTDSRIRTYIYNPNEVYLLTLSHGFQSTIEFDKQEQIETISLGDSYSWSIKPMGNRIFIKPLEKNIHTNMTIITNKHTYHFDVIAKAHDEEYSPQDITYVVRFFYPKKYAKSR